MVELVDRFEAKYQRRISVLLENGSCEKSCLEAMGRSCANHAAKSTHRLARRLGVVGQIVQPALNRQWCAKLVNQPAFSRRQIETRRLNPASARKTTHLTQLPT